jgi:hypothetical protein
MTIAQDLLDAGDRLVDRLLGLIPSAATRCTALLQLKFATVAIAPTTGGPMTMSRCRIASASPVRDEHADRGVLRRITPL